MQYIFTRKYRLITLLMFIAVIATSSCARKITFGTSVVVPAAEGRVKVKRDNNKNYELNISLKNLVEASQLIPSRNLYVVWMETDEGSTKNLGRMNISSRLFSKTKRASLNTVTPLKPRRIFITAENDATIQYPGPQIVMATERF